jgi:glycosyltransferase involved in cell wall biosynthesis
MSIERLVSPDLISKEEETFNRTLRPPTLAEYIGQKKVVEKLEIALEAARRARMPIKVVGSGPEAERLKTLYGDAQFMGRVSDSELAALYSSALAVVIPNIEEFGITAVEAQAAGRPVVAAAAGGVLETVVPGKTGVLVTPGDIDELARVLHETDFDGFDPNAIKANAGAFSRQTFQRGLAAEVDRVLAAPESANALIAYMPPSVTSVAGPSAVRGSAA